MVRGEGGGVREDGTFAVWTSLMVTSKMHGGCRDCSYGCAACTLWAWAVWLGVMRSVPCVGAAPAPRAAERGRARRLFGAGRPVPCDLDAVVGPHCAARCELRDVRWCPPPPASATHPLVHASPGCLCPLGRASAWRAGSCGCGGSSCGLRRACAPECRVSWPPSCSCSRSRHCSLRTASCVGLIPALTPPISTMFISISISLLWSPRRGPGARRPSAEVPRTRTENRSRKSVKLP